VSEECPYCNWPEGAWKGCRAKQNPGSAGYECSREEGHPGPHVACGTTCHDLARWGADEVRLEDGDLTATVEINVDDGSLRRATFVNGDEENGGQVFTVLDAADLMSLASLASEAALLVEAT
jgi:hypothetical protein